MKAPTRAMVLAAGLGTRLRPLTDTRPKALVEVAGKTMLERTLLRLRSFGVEEVVVNAHHHADLLINYLNDQKNFGMQIEVSREEILLDTGGGLKQAAEFFLRSGSDAPFILHNVDVASAIDLAEMVAEHKASGALATLAVKPRSSSRQLLFDAEGDLVGRQTPVTTEWAREMIDPTPLAFCGIHVISPRIFALMEETGIFSIVPVYLRLAAAGERIAAYQTSAYWRDLGKLESVHQAEADLAAGMWD
jgi:NDP-sugar pyrophosphorylase family protein